MEFRAERDVLAALLSDAGRAVGRRSGSIPVLGCLRLTVESDRLTVEGTDLEIAVSTSADVAGMGDGAVALPARLITDVVKTLPPGAVTVTEGEGTVEVTSGRAAFTLRTVAVDEWPMIDWPDGDAPLIPAKELLGAVDRVAPAASTDDSRPILTGMLLQRLDGGLRLVATDSYRLMFEDLPHGAALGDTPTALVPAAALELLAKVASKDGDVAVHLDDRSVCFTVGDSLRISSRLIEGAFPNYDGLIPKAHPGLLRTGRDAFAEAVKRVRLLARESTPIRVTLAPSGDLALSAVTQDVGQAYEVFDGDYTGPEMLIAFNPGYLLDALEAAPGDDVTLAVLDSRNPAVLRVPAVDDWLALLMPVRVS